MNKRDLFIVVADLDAENAIKTLLTERQEALGIALDFSPLFAELARRLGFHSCEDPAFNKLRNTLQQWFPR